MMEKKRSSRRGVIAAIILLAVAGLVLGGYQLYRRQQQDHWSREEEMAREKMVAAMKRTEIRFTGATHDFGTIEEGEEVAHDYRFVNAGTAPLRIARVDVSCGCTVTDFPKEEIPPGGSGTIRLQFNSRGKSGVVHKSAIVHSNATMDRYSISFTATVRNRK